MPLPRMRVTISNHDEPAHESHRAPTLAQQMHRPPQHPIPNPKPKPKPEFESEPPDLDAKPNASPEPCQSIQCQPAAFQSRRSHNNSSISITVSSLFILSSSSIKKPIVRPCFWRIHFILMPFSNSPTQQLDEEHTHVEDPTLFLFFFF